MSPVRLEISTAAGSDLRNIVAYAELAWNAEQASAYYQSRMEQIELLARFPEMGMLIRSLGHEVRRLRHASHNIVYRRSPEAVQILRILHVRRRLLEEELGGTD